MATLDKAAMLKAANEARKADAALPATMNRWRDEDEGRTLDRATDMVRAMNDYALFMELPYTFRLESGQQELPVIATGGKKKP